MTERERKVARLLIDAARRERIQPLCDWCGDPIIGPRQRYCSDNHRRYAWLRTEKGRRLAREAKRRRRARARAVQAA